MCNEFLTSFVGRTVAKTFDGKYYRGKVLYALISQSPIFRVRFARKQGEKEFEMALAEVEECLISSDDFEKQLDEDELEEWMHGLVVSAPSGSGLFLSPVALLTRGSTSLHSAGSFSTNLRGRRSTRGVLHSAL